MHLTRLMLAFARAFIVSLVLTPIVRDIFRSYNVVDRPGRRKVHAYPIPRVGGVSIMSAYVIGLVSLRGPGTVFAAHWLQTILSGAAIIFLTGLIDDFLNLKPTVKLMGQIVAAAVSFESGIRINNLMGFALPVWLSLPLTIFWLLLATNALNLIDGLDGLCGGIGFWATLAFFAAALIAGNITLAATALPLAGALLGFLFFNFNPATVFMGDSGALLTGFLLGSLGIVWASDHHNLIGAAFPLFALCIPMMDLGLSIIRRTLNARPIFSADRGHTHHRLLDGGLAARRAALTLYSAEICGATFGLALCYLALRYRGASRGLLAAVVIAGAIAATVAGIRRLRYAEFEVTAHLLFRGEFRNVYTRRVRMQQLALSLQSAPDADEWWRRLIAAAGKEKWIRLQWKKSDRGCEGELHEAVLADRKPAWTFSLDLDRGDSLLVEGDDQSAEGSPDLVGLSCMLTRTFKSTRSKWEQSTLS